VRSGDDHRPQAEPRRGGGSRRARHVVRRRRLAAPAQAVDPRRGARRRGRARRPEPRLVHRPAPRAEPTVRRAAQRDLQRPGGPPRGARRRAFRRAADLCRRHGLGERRATQGGVRHARRPRDPLLLAVSPHEHQQPRHALRLPAPARRGETGRRRGRLARDRRGALAAAQPFSRAGARCAAPCRRREDCA
jgi:hypothetical protein